MTPRRPTVLLIACALLASVAAGCTKGEDHDPVREGIATDLGGLDYNVFLTRQLNPRDPAGDRDYYDGPEQSEECLERGDSRTPPELTPEERLQQCPTALYAVFLQVCNETSDGAPRSAREATIDRNGREFAGDFEIEDSQGNKFEPLPLSPENVFAYRSVALPKGECIPKSGSAASTTPAGGAVMIFRLPVAATENRPLELSISSNGETKHFELDL